MTKTTRLFISSGTDDFAELRDFIKSRFAETIQYKPITQRMLPPTTFALGTIAKHVKGCDIIVQLLGETPGSIPPVEDVEKLLAENPKLAAILASEPMRNEWTYTQWEGVLACTFEKGVLPFVSPELKATHRIAAYDRSVTSPQFRYLSWLRSKSIRAMEPPEFCQNPLFDFIRAAVEEYLSSTSYSNIRSTGQEVTPSPRIMPDANLEGLLSQLLDAKGSELVQRLAEEMRWGRKENTLQAVKQLDSWLESIEGSRCSPQVRTRCKLIVMNALIDQTQTIKSSGQVNPEIHDRLKEIDRNVCESDPELQAMLLSVSAWLMYLDGEPSKAINELQRSSHEVATANLLSMMIQKNRWEDAENIVDTRLVAERWLEQALIVLVHSLRLEDAAKLFAKVDQFESTVRKHRCYFIYADSLRFHAFRERERGSRLFPFDITEVERSVLQVAYDALAPLRNRVNANQRIDGDLELAGMELAYQLEYLLSKHSISETARYLADSTPISKTLPTMVFQGLFKTDRVLYQKLASDWPGDDEAILGAAAICTFQNENLSDAIEFLSRINLEKLDIGQTKQLGDIYCDIACIGKTPEQEQAYSQLITLKQPDDPILNLVRAVWESKKDNFEIAIQLLNEKPMPEDPDWLSVYAQSLNSLERFEEAYEKVDSLTKVAPIRHVLMRAVILARKLKKTADEIRFLRELVRRGSSDILPELATALANFGEKESLDESSRLFLDLSTTFPNEPIYRFNLACAYRSQGKTANALVELEHVTRSHPDFVYGWEGRSQILIQMGSERLALQVLNTPELRTRFQGEVRFWRALHTAAHTSGATHIVLECLSRIHSLESLVGESRRTIQVLTTEQMQSYLKESHATQLDIANRYESGLFPCHLLSVGSHHHSWRSRTATKSFATRGGPSSRSQSYVTNPNREFFSNYASLSSAMKLPRVPPKGKVAVADITSLITLHELGILPKASKYFSKILLPFEYRQIAIQEQSYSDPAIEALFRSVQHVLSMIAGQRLSTLEDTEFPFVKMEELCQWLKQKEPSPSVQNVLDQLSHGTNRADWKPSSDNLLVDASTLISMESVGALEFAVQSIRLRVSDTTRDELERERSRLQWILDSKSSAKALWETVLSNDLFDFSAAAPKTHEPDSDSFEGQLPWNFALRLAKTENLDLLVDDRVIQSIFLNELRDKPSNVFGTDLLLEELAAESILTRDEVSNSYIKLMSWRYRFLDVPFNRLTEHWNADTNAIPDILRACRDYARECMNDSGLLQSQISENNPFSFAIVFAVNWAQSIIDFVIATWDTEAVTKNIRTERVNWAIDNLLTLIPNRISVDAEYYLANVVPKLCISKILLERIARPDHERTAELLQKFRYHFQLNEIQYSRIVAEVLERTSNTHLDLELSDQRTEQLRHEMKRSILIHAFEHLHTAKVYNLSVQSNAVFLVSGTLQQQLDSSVPSHILKQAIFQDVRHKSFPPVGPLIFYKSGESLSGCIALRDMMYRADPSARSLGTKYLQALATTRPDLMAPQSNELISRHASDCFSDAIQQWYPACDAIWTSLDQDWLFNLAGVRQFQFGASWEGSEDYWREAFQPSVHPAYSAPPVAVAGATDPKIIRQALDLLLDSMGLDGIVRRYMAFFQHLPLEPPFSLGSVLRGKLKQFGTRQILKSVLKVANSNRILEACHGTSACLEFWSEASPDEKRQIARCVSRVSVACVDQNGGSPLSRCHILQNKLTQYYSAWIRLFGPERNANDTLCLASWMASKFAPVLLHSVEAAESPKAAFRKLLKEQIDRRLEHASFARSFVSPSPLLSAWDVQNQLFHLGGPFLFSLLGRIVPNQFRSLYGRLDSHGRTAVDQFFVRRTIYPVVGITEGMPTVFTSKMIETIYSLNQIWSDSFGDRPTDSESAENDKDEEQEDGANVIHHFFQTAFQHPLAERRIMWEQLLTIAYNGARDIQIIESALCSGDFLSELLRKGEIEDLELFPQFILQVFGQWNKDSQDQFLHGLFLILSERQVPSNKRVIVINLILVLAQITDNRELISQLRLVHLSVEDKKHLTLRIEKIRRTIERLPQWARTRLISLQSGLVQVLE